jgi:hypothetical protein
MMIENILAVVSEMPTEMLTGMPTAMPPQNGINLLVPIIAFVVYLFILTLVIICLVRIARYFKSAGKEQKLVRMELGKLAEEVRLIRQQLPQE